MKKLLSFILTAAMLLSFTTVFADGFIPASYPIADEDMSLVDTWADGSTPNLTIGRDRDWHESLTSREVWVNGLVWGSHYNPQVGKRLDFDPEKGMIFYTITDKDNDKIELKKNIFANKGFFSKSDIKFTVDFSTYNFLGEDGHRSAAWFCMNDRDIEVMAYDARFGVLRVAGVKNGYVTWESMTGYVDKVIQLEENSAYTAEAYFAYDKQNDIYDVTYKVFDAEGNQVGETIFVDNYYVLEDAADINKTLLVFNRAESTRATEQTPYIAIKNIKIDNVLTDHAVKFGEIQYTDKGDLVNENAGKFFSYDTLANSFTDPNYLAGRAWASPTASEVISKKVFSSDGNSLYMNVSADDKDKTRSIYKKFEAAKAGEKLTYTADFTFAGHRGGTETNIFTAFLSNSDGTKTFEVFRLKYANYNSNGNELRLADKNKTQGIGWNPETFGECKLVAVFTPNSADENYTAKVTIYKPDNSVLLESGEVAVSKDIVTNLDNIRFDSVSGVAATIEKPFIFNNITITTENGNEATGLVAGENKIYTTYENMTSNAFDVAGIVGVYDASGKLVRAKLVEKVTYSAYKGLIGTTVTVDNPQTEYVKLFLFNDLKSLVPWTTAKCSK